jgi:hypothetical protein
MSANTSKSTSLLWLASAPPLALALFGLLLGLGVPPVTEWFWPTPTTNVAEAAALGDAARVRALAATGARLDLPLPVREGIRNRDEPAVMSAIEAARRRGHDELVQLLIELGGNPPADGSTAGVP